MQPLILTLQAMRRIEKHVHTSDDEVCGFLSAAAPDRAENVHPVENIAPEPRTAFYMEPQQQYQALVAIEAAGLQLTAIYHSHPSGARTGFSTSDTEGAWGYVHVAHLVVAKTADATLSMRAFRFSKRQAVEIDVRIDRLMDAEIN